MIKAAQETIWSQPIIDAEYNEQKGEVDLYEFKTVVEEIEDDETEILLDDARQLNASIELGDSLGMPLEYDALGRIPAQKAKQVLYQRIREAERDMLFEGFREMKGKVVNGVVRRFEKRSIIVTIGNSEAQTEAIAQKRASPKRDLSIR